MTEMALTVALAGNPNCGKTTLFNSLTGARQHVGNYPGVTVEKREGTLRFQNKPITLIDLPGTYSLSANSEDERIARQFIVSEAPDVVVNVVDATNLERNLYLTLQLIELGRPMVLCLNMADEARKQNILPDLDKLSQSLGVPVVATVGTIGQGIQELLSQVLKASRNVRSTNQVDYGPVVEPGRKELIQELEAALTAGTGDWKYPLPWTALKLIESDTDVIANLKLVIPNNSFWEAYNQTAAQIEEESGDSPDLVIAERRHILAGEIFRLAVGRHSQAGQETLSDKVDKILTNRALGLPIFFGLMWLLFNLVFTLGSYPQDWLDQVFSSFGDYISSSMPDGVLKDLLVNAVIGGVGSVLSFLPQILLLFLGIAFLEDSGYMARAAFVMDRVMRAAGLHGKSFIPLIMGFGCSVPAVMSTRTLESPRDRLVTMLVVPFMSCSARLPVYTLLIGAFFAPGQAGTVLFSIYLLGIIIAIAVAKILRKSYFHGESEPFVMELPPYRLPLFKNLMLHMWERGGLYLKKAGTIILAMSILMWFLTNYPEEVPFSKDYDALTTQAEESFAKQVNADIALQLNVEKLGDHAEFQALDEAVAQINDEFDQKIDGLDEASAEYTSAANAKEAALKDLEEKNPDLYALVDRYEELKGDLEDQKDQLDKEKKSEKLELSYAGQIGKTIEPIVAPLGFDWKVGVSLIAATTAKEVLVSTLGTIYDVGDADETSKALSDALQHGSGLTPLTAYGLMVFVLLYVPCLATLAVIYRETNTWKWPLFIAAYTVSLAWLVTFAIVQTGHWLGF